MSGNRYDIGDATCLCVDCDRHRAEMREGAAEIDRLTAEIERLRAASQWQPIETAPKDGTKVLVWRPYEDKDHEAHCGVDRWSDVSGSWWNSRRYQQPTQWQPLPSPPTQEGGG